MKRIFFRSQRFSVRLPLASWRYSHSSPCALQYPVSWSRLSHRNRSVSGLFQPVASGILVSLFTYPVPARRLRLQVATTVIAIGLIAFAIAQPGA